LRSLVKKSEEDDAAFLDHDGRRKVRFSIFLTLAK